VGTALRDLLGAVERDPGCAEAYHLALPILFAQGDLPAAERLARRAAAACGEDPAWSARFEAEYSYAKEMRLGLETAQSMLAAEERRHSSERSPEAVERYARALLEHGGRRLEEALRKKIEGVLQSAAHMVRVKEARAYISGTKQDSQWEDAWAVLYR